MNTRREFLCTLPIACASLVAARTAQAADLPMVGEKDPQATALGYVADATKADKAKFPKYASGQQCSGCALYQGKAGDASGACPLFAGRQVAAKGWCGTFTKKA
jgi:hypothetical protein